MLQQVGHCDLVFVLYFMRIPALSSIFCDVVNENGAKTTCAMCQLFLALKFILF